MTEGCVSAGVNYPLWAVKHCSTSSGYLCKHFSQQFWRLQEHLQQQSSCDIYRSSRELNSYHASVTSLCYSWTLLNRTLWNRRLCMPSLYGQTLSAIRCFPTIRPELLEASDSSLRVYQEWLMHHIIVLVRFSSTFQWIHGQFNVDLSHWHGWNRYCSAS